MSFEPLLNAPMYLQLHVGAAMLAVVLGPVPMYRRRRDIWHKTFGYIWVVAMATVALSSFFIHTFSVIGPFSPLHGLALLTLWTLWRGVANARAGNIQVHLRQFRSLYWYGVMIAGLANFLPDRRINQIAFGGEDHFGWIVIGIGAAGLVAYTVRGRFRDVGTVVKVS